MGTRRTIPWAEHLSSQLRSATEDSAESLLYSANSIMAVFGNKKYPSAARAGTFASRFRIAVGRHPFLLFGLPFISVVVAGSFVLTPATAIRYEKQDRRVRQMSREEELNVGANRRKVDIREEYFVRPPQGAVEARSSCANKSCLCPVFRGCSRRTPITGSKNESSGCRARGTACSRLRRSTNCTPAFRSWRRTGTLHRNEVILVMN